MSSSDNNDKIMIKLKASDNQVFEIEKSNIVNQSKPIKHMVEDVCAENVIPLLNVDGQTLAKIIEWCKKHRVETRNEEEEEIKKWEDSFVEVDQPTLFSLINAADYLDIHKLLNRLCEKVASMMEGKKVEELRELFHIKNDLTPEEEGAIKKEHSWAFAG